jgi:hypothetical protein
MGGQYPQLSDTPQDFSKILMRMESMAGVIEFYINDYLSNKKVIQNNIKQYKPFVSISVIPPTTLKEYLMKLLNIMPRFENKPKETLAEVKRYPEIKVGDFIFEVKLNPQIKNLSVKFYKKLEDYIFFVLKNKYPKLKFADSTGKIRGEILV